MSRPSRTTAKSVSSPATANPSNAVIPISPRPSVSCADEFIIDGEIVALDAQGRHSFSTLQKIAGPSSAHLRFYAFDLLTLDGQDLTKLPLARRRQLLEAKIPMPAGSLVQPGPVFQGDPGHIVAKVREFGFEGVVAKRLDSRYESGERTGAWLKMRTNLRQEFVIGGYVPGAHTFDSLLVGVYQGKTLHFVAKVRNGFVPRTRQEIFPTLQKLRTPACPFANLPEEKRGRWGEAITAEKMAECRWIKPLLVSEIAFLQWTNAGHLRHCTFLALRDDKPARQVVRET